MAKDGLCLRLRTIESTGSKAIGRVLHLLQRRKRPAGAQATGLSSARARPARQSFRSRDSRKVRAAGTALYPLSLSICPGLQVSIPTVGSMQCETNLQPGTSFGLVMPCSSSIRFAGTACPPAKIGLRSPPFRSLVAVSPRLRSQAEPKID